MMFSEKLNFLMNLTGTSNSTLAHVVMLDASYISRLRAGKRLFPKNEACVRGMAVYFSRHCSKEYQQKAIADVLKLTVFPCDEEKLAPVIAQWLLGEEAGDAQRVDRFLTGLIKMTEKTVVTQLPQSKHYSFPREDISLYYGVEGKRQAVLHFLSEIVSASKPQTLLLFSDEETSWMTADPAFAQQWAALMFQTLAKGNRIRIIHTISRNLDEMLSAISQWMPLYMTGAIEPYFYPKKRDGIFKRTLFISPETSAVVSSSVGEQTAHAVNILFHNTGAITGYSEEFSQYFRLCRPLMKIFTIRNREACIAMLCEFDKEYADTLIKTESLSLLTMPETLFSKILFRAGIAWENLQDIHWARRLSFKHMLETNHFTEIIVLPEIDAIKNGEVKVALSDLLSGGAVYYTLDEYARHLSAIIELLNKNSRFHIHVIKQPAEERYMVYAREELGVIVGKTSQPPVVLAMNEGNMTAAFWDFLKSIVGERAYENPDNTAAVKILQSYVERLLQL